MKSFVATLGCLALAACGGESTYEPPQASRASAPDPVEASPVRVDDEVAHAEPEVEFLPRPDLEPEASEPVAEVQTASFELRRGETPAHFARWAELPVEDIATASDLVLDGQYEVGTELKIPLTGEPLSTIEARRHAHHLARAERYLSSRGGSLGSEFYTVRSGDSAWTIARDEVGVPVWLIETYNPAVNLDSLRPGQELMVPIIADIVVDAEKPDSAESAPEEPAPEVPPLITD